MPTITIEVTPDIAAKIRGMADSGVFAIIKGSATLNFVNGVLKIVKTEVYTTVQPYPHLKNVDIIEISPILQK